MSLDLRNILEQAGITPVRESKKEILARCPMHEQRTGKPDHHPSWSINQYTYTHFCFSCGYKGTLNSLLIDVLGEAPEDLEKTLAKEGFIRKMAEAREAPDTVLEPVKPILTEWVLHNIHIDVPERMLSFRHLRRSAVDFYEVRWDTDTKRWVLPLRSVAGELLGAQYRQKGSVYTLPEGIPKSRRSSASASAANRNTAPSWSRHSTPYASSASASRRSRHSEHGYRRIRSVSWRATSSVSTWLWTTTRQVTRVASNSARRSLEPGPLP